MWFGNLVTMTLVERPLAQRVVRRVGVDDLPGRGHRSGPTPGRPSARREGLGLRQDQLSSTHPIVAEIRDLEDVEVNFDGITYAKGASVLKQLVAYVGREPFRDGPARLLRQARLGQHDPRRPARRAREDVRPRPDARGRRLWLETAGVSTLRPVVEVDDRRALSPPSPSSRPAPPSRTDAAPAPPRHRAVCRPATGRGDVLERIGYDEVDVDGARTDIGARLVGREQPDLLLVNDDDLAYAQDPPRRALARDRAVATRAASRTRCRARSCSARRGT